MARDQARQVAGLIDILFNQPDECIDAMSLERHPDFQGFEASRQFDSSLGKRQASGHDSPRRFAQIARRHGKRLSMSLGIAHQNAGNLER